MQEIWRPLSGQNGDYSVSNLGRIRSNERAAICFGGYKKMIPSKILKAHDTENGYKRIDIRGTKYLMHRAVAEAFVPGANADLIVNHINGNKSDNRAENLEWISQQENVIHAMQTGLRTLKLTEREIEKILEMRASGMLAKQIAEKFSICISYVYYLERYKAPIDIPTPAYELDLSAIF